MHTILLVEDDKLFRWALKEALAEAGYRVLEATSCRQARENFANRVDLALLDYRLPDCTGFSLLDEIKRAKLSYPVIILTAHPTDEGEVEARRLGAHAYLAKPDDPLEVAHWVRVALDNTRIST
jgi:DNA-binding response OmpR family regulator